MPSRMRSMQTTRKSPTPTETVMMSTAVFMCGTLEARTCRSGSATVIATPRMKLSARMSQSLRVLVMRAPVWLPICVMDASAPRVKRPIPTMSIMVPSRKASIRSVVTGTKLRHISATMSAMGSTDEMDSFSFSRSIVLPGVGRHLLWECCSAVSACPCRA